MAYKAGVVGRPHLPRFLVFAAALLLACGAPRPPSFVVLLVDTLRLDRLHFAAPGAPQTPAFDRLRAESVWFERAYANSSWTLPSVASLLLAQLPSEHRVASWGARLASDQVTLPDVLRSAGYRTAMFTANRIIAGGRGFVGRFDAGALVEDPEFSGELHTEAAFASAEAVAERSLDWLAGVREQRGTPYLLLLHFMEPHAPYPCPRAADADCSEVVEALNQRLLGFDWDFPAADRARIDASYDAGVAQMDAALAALLETLAVSGVLNEAWLVLLADHGELLGEDDLYLHGRSLAEPLVRVPLLFRPPGGGRGARVDTPVSLVGVAPTLLELAGRPAPAAFRGRSFAAALRGEALAPEPVVVELPQVRPTPDPRRRHVYALVDAEETWLVAPDGSVERRARAGRRTAAPRSADRAALDAHLSARGLAFDPAAYSGAEFEEPSQEMLDALQRLGYVE
ncbi:MAG: sulfatase [Deltaproteobacteria bacterium]|nr:sulfatase [Deltaproteobacteria bacterium]MBW2360710.1 sulfatase [Deltaproteobacteria bacterium]